MTVTDSRCHIREEMDEMQTKGKYFIYFYLLFEFGPDIWKENVENSKLWVKCGVFWYNKQSAIK